MSTFDSTKLRLDDDLLKPIVEGKIQLPDFQRGWVWDDEHIRSLLVSLARSFPIGAVMLLQTGGAAKFQTRPVEGVELPSDIAADKLILDGQQRLTSLTRVLKLKSPVLTRDEKKRDILRYYYFDVATALEGPQSLEASIIAVDVNRQLRENFGRDVKLDLSTPELEYAALHFPCNQVLNADAWEEGLNATRPDLFATYMKFRTAVLKPIREYLVPAITLTKETSKEAVCLVFEKVNTGGVTLSVFELITATFAAEGFNLREDWYGGPKGKGQCR